MNKALPLLALLAACGVEPGTNGDDLGTGALLSTDSYGDTGIVPGMVELIEPPAPTPRASVCE